MQILELCVQSCPCFFSCSGFICSDFGSGCGSCACSRPIPIHAWCLLHSPVPIPPSNNGMPFPHRCRRSAATVAAPWPTWPRGRLLLLHQRASCPGAAAATWPSTAGGSARWRTGRAGTRRSARRWRRSTRSGSPSPCSSPGYTYFVLLHGVKPRQIITSVKCSLTPILIAMTTNLSWKFLK